MEKHTLFNLLKNLNNSGKTLFNIAVLAVICCLYVSASAQSFEGMVVYKNTYKSKMPTLGDEQLTSMMGETQNWYIKNSDYKSETNGTYTIWQLYTKKDNKIYTKVTNSEAVLYNDASVSDNEIISAEIHKGVTDILGYKCDELDMVTKTGLQKYFFSSKLPIDSKLFVGHNMGDWYAYLSKANAVPLKMIIETPQMSLESVATDVKPMQLNANMFVLPENTQVVKSPQ